MVTFFWQNLVFSKLFVHADFCRWEIKVLHEFLPLQPVLSHPALAPGIHRYQHAITLADKLVSFSDHAPEDVFLLANAYFLSGQHKRCLHLLKYRSLVPGVRCDPAVLDV